MVKFILATLFLFNYAQALTVIINDVPFQTNQPIRYVTELCMVEDIVYQCHKIYLKGIVCTGTAIMAPSFPNILNAEGRNVANWISFNYSGSTATIRTAQGITCSDDTIMKNGFDD